MQTQKTFCNSDRYIFDYDICSFKKGFAQIDTNEDASYFGNWVNFKSLELITYCEGDLTVIKCDDIKEFKEQLFKVGYLRVRYNNLRDVQIIDVKKGDFQ